MQARSLHETDHWPSPHTVEGAGENLHHPCKNISLPATNIVVMPVDIAYTTKLSEEQRKFFSISTGSPSWRRRKTSTTFDLPYLQYPTNCANESSATSGKHTLSNGWAKILDESSSKTAKRIFFHRLVPSSSSCLFVVTAPFFLCAHSTWSWSSTELAHHTQWLCRGARNVLPIPAVSKLTAKDSISMLTAGHFSTKWREFESTFSQ